MLFGGLIFVTTYKTTEEKIYELVNGCLYYPDRPAEKLKMEDYKDIKDYAKDHQELEIAYEEAVFEEVGKQYNKTPEQIKKIYMDEFIKKYDINLD